MPENILHLDAPAYPLWFLAGIAFAIPALCAALGWRLGRHSYLADGFDKTPASAIPGDTTLNAILAILGLLLAFSYGFALSRAETRKVTLVEEAATISTAFLRADLLDEPGRSALREAIGSYARTRYSDENVARSDDALDSYLSQTLSAQARLWPTALAALGRDTPPAVSVQVTNGVTEVLDAHTRRLAAGIDGVPTIAKMAILLYSSIALFLVGNRSALRGNRLSWRTFAFSTALSVMMVLVIDFERPREGFVRLDPTVMKITIAEIDAALANK